MHSSAPRFAAFISYRHKPRDREWAIRIMRLRDLPHTKAIAGRGIPCPHRQ